MSAVVQSDHASAALPSSRSAPASWPVRRLIIAAVGCAVMALSGTGLANYLDTSGVTGADSSSSGVSQADAATLN